MLTAGDMHAIEKSTRRIIMMRTDKRKMESLLERSKKPLEKGKIEKKYVNER